MHVFTTELLPWAESPRNRIGPTAPAARATAIAWATIRPTPLPQPVRPVRSRIHGDHQCGTGQQLGPPTQCGQVLTQN